jgi:GNAT superfamily N-acetyltransferase
VVRAAFTVASLADRPELSERLPFGPGWPEFIFHDPVARRYMPDVDRLFPEFNLVLLDTGDTAIAGGWGVPIPWDGTVAGLPQGWDGALELAVATRERGEPATTMCAMASEVVGSHRGTGLGGAILRALRAQGEARGLTSMVAPARPTEKHRYPLTPIERYAEWVRPGGEPFDPWLRTHTRVGARVLATEREAMRIVGTVAEWEEWVGMALPDSGDFVIPAALAPVTIDREADTGVYIEPAVWMLHA